jgi:hypothetical protein
MMFVVLACNKDEKKGPRWCQGNKHLMQQVSHAQCPMPVLLTAHVLLRVAGHILAGTVMHLTLYALRRTLGLATTGLGEMEGRDLRLCMFITVGPMKKL